MTPVSLFGKPRPRHASTEVLSYCWYCLLFTARGQWLWKLPSIVTLLYYKYTLYSKVLSRFHSGLSPNLLPVYLDQRWLMLQGWSKVQFSLALLCKSINSTERLGPWMCPRRTRVRGRAEESEGVKDRMCVARSSVRGEQWACAGVDAFCTFYAETQSNIVYTV